MLKIEFKGKGYTLSNSDILKLEGICLAITTARAKQQERKKKIAFLILNNRELLAEMLKLSNEELEKIATAKTEIDYGNFGLMKTRATPYKKEN